MPIKPRQELYKPATEHTALINTNILVDEIGVIEDPRFLTKYGCGIYHVEEMQKASAVVARQLFFIMAGYKRKGNGTWTKQAHK